MDLTDWNDCEQCLVGAGGGLGEGCECFDFDDDGENDLQDFATFQAAFGP